MVQNAVNEYVQEKEVQVLLNLVYDAKVRQTNFLSARRVQQQFLTSLQSQLYVLKDKTQIIVVMLISFVGK